MYIFVHVAQPPSRLLLPRRAATAPTRAWATLMRRDHEHHPGGRPRLEPQRHDQRTVGPAASTAAQRLAPPPWPSWRASCRLDAGAHDAAARPARMQGPVPAVRSTDDRRVVNLELTPEGEAAAAKVPTCCREVQNAHLAGFHQDRVDAAEGLPPPHARQRRGDCREVGEVSRCNDRHRDPSQGRGTGIDHSRHRPGLDRSCSLWPAAPAARASRRAPPWSTGQGGRRPPRLRRRLAPTGGTASATRALTR